MADLHQPSIAISLRALFQLWVSDTYGMGQAGGIHDHWTAFYSGLYARTTVVIHQGLIIKSQIEAVIGIREFGRQLYGYSRADMGQIQLISRVWSDHYRAVRVRSYERDLLGDPGFHRLDMLDL